MACDEGRTCWVSDIPLALVQPTAEVVSLAQSLLLPVADDQATVTLTADDGTIAGYAGQPVVKILAQRFGPVERVQVRIKTASHTVAEGDQRSRKLEHRSWALVTFVNEEDARACVDRDGMRVPETLVPEPGRARVPLRIRRANVKGELAKGQRGALAQVAAKDDQDRAAIAKAKKLNVMKRPTFKDAVRAVIQMQRVVKQFDRGLPANKLVAPVAPVQRGRSLHVRWIAEDPCGLSIGPQPWTERNTSYHRSSRTPPSIKLVRRTVYNTPKQLTGVPRGQNVKRESQRLRRKAHSSRDATPSATKAGADIDRQARTEFQTLWKQLSANGWRTRLVKRPRVKRPYTGAEVSGGVTPLGETWHKSDPFTLAESYVRPGRWGPGERATAKLGVDYFSSPQQLQAFLRRAPQQLKHSRSAKGTPHMHLYGL